MKTLNNWKQEHLVHYFALGDALGKDFEFRTPSQEQLYEKYHGNSTLSFTDDTYLVLSTCYAINNLQSAKINHSFCISTAEYLKDWFESNDFRGIGDTTYSALKQIYRYDFESSDALEFQLSSRAYETSISAGNGILSRALPLSLYNIEFDSNFVKWLQLTHMHIEGYKAVISMMKYIQKGVLPLYTFDQNSKGFYAHETLGIAINAVLKSRNLYEVFVNTQVPDGDNDSNAALAFALWYLTGKSSTEELNLVKRLHSKDLKLINKVLIL